MLSKFSANLLRVNVHPNVIRNLSIIFVGVLLYCSSLLAEESKDVEPPVVSEKSNTEGVSNEPFFGRYKVGIGATRPLNLANQENYELFYGSVPAYPVLMVEYTPINIPFFNFGLRGTFGYFSDTGYASKNPPDQGYEKDKNSKISLSMVPITLGAQVQTSPFRGKWIVLSAWFAFERTSYEETRTVQEQAAAIGLESERRNVELAQKPFVNSGVVSGTNMGASLNIKITPLNQGSVNLMEDTMGLREIYLSPFYEQSKLTKKAVEFSRSSAGIAFVFESVF